FSLPHASRPPRTSYPRDWERSLGGQLCRGPRASLPGLSWQDDRERSPDYRQSFRTSCLSPRAEQIGVDRSDDNQQRPPPQAYMQFCQDARLGRRGHYFLHSHRGDQHTINKNEEADEIPDRYLLLSLRHESLPK